MENILDINGIQTSKLAIEDYEEMISTCDMRIFQIEEWIYESSANEIINQELERRLNTYKSIMNRLSQRVINLQNNGN
jgi:hypothetical protein